MPRIKKTAADVRPEDKKDIKAEVLKDMDPEIYFKDLKDKINTTSSEELKTLYKVVQVQLQKAYALKQKIMISKLLFTLDVLEKEQKLNELGFKTFIYRDDVEYYIEKVAKQVVKIQDLASYPREIPDEVAQKIVRLQEANIFDDYYVVFTDYTGKIEREVAAERRRKDPILFGIFKTSEGIRQLHDRFYYIADWEDQYCDLTLSKMVSEMAAAGKSIERPVFIEDVSESTIRDYVANLLESNDRLRIPAKQSKVKSFFSKIAFWR